MVLALLVGSLGHLWHRWRVDPGAAAGRQRPAGGHVAPAALASTFVTSIVGAATYALLSLTASASIAPNWRLGLVCGLGGYVGAWLQPWLPERAPRRLLGPLAIGLASLYLIQATR
jgi:uncharacterized membrane protein YfcA